MLQGDVEKIARTAGGVEHAHGAQAVVKGASLLNGALEVTATGEGYGGSLRTGPLLAEGLDHRWQHEPLDIGARRVVRAEFMALSGIERAFQQGAEDGGFDVTPRKFSGATEQAELSAVERQRRCLGE